MLSRLRQWSRRRPRASVRGKPANVRDVRAPLRLERLEDRILLDATPVATVNAPAEGLINEGVSFGVTFDNTGADVGFAPFVDVVAPKGVTVNSATVDGIAANRQTVGYWDAIDSRWESAPDGSGTAVTTNLPDDEDLAISFAIQNGEAVAKTMTVDYIFVAKER
jgi:hypothetical protein